jgi:hypothetical protein
MEGGIELGIDAAFPAWGFLAAFSVSDGLGWKIAGIAM